MLSDYLALVNPQKHVQHPCSNILDTSHVYPSLTISLTRNSSSWNMPICSTRRDPLQYLGNSQHHSGLLYQPCSSVLELSIHLSNISSPSLS